MYWNWIVWHGTSKKLWKYKFLFSTALWMLFQEFWILHYSADLINKMFDLVIETSCKIFPKRPNNLNDLRPNLICVTRILRSNNWCLISPSVWIRSHPWSFPDCLSRTIHPSLSSIFYQLWASLQSKPRLCLAQSQIWFYQLFKKDWKQMLSNHFQTLVKFPCTS